MYSSNILSHSIVDSLLDVALNCRTSPSTRLAMTVANSSTTSFEPSLERATDARPSKKSPERIDSLEPKADGAEGKFRRNAELSMTSSCNNDATWIISVMLARRLCVERISGVPGELYSEARGEDCSDGGRGTVYEEEEGSIELKMSDREEEEEALVDASVEADDNVDDGVERFEGVMLNGLANTAPGLLC